MKVWGKRDKFDPPIKSLLYKMVSDKWVDWCRKYGQMKVVRGENHETMDSHDPQRAMESEEAREVMKKALEDLPESQRSVFLMNRLEGLTYSEIADRLGVGQKAIEKRMSLALKHLRHCWQQYEQ